LVNGVEKMSKINKQTTIDLGKHIYWHYSDSIPEISHQLFKDGTVKTISRRSVPDVVEDS